MIYLDNAAATPIDDRVLRAMMPYFSDDFYNPSAAYLAARRVRSELEDARHKLAQIIGARPAEIVVTAGATESINIALNGVDGNIVTIATEHPAVLATVGARTGVVLGVDSNGRVNLDELNKSLTNQVGLVTVSYVNSETGVVQNLRAIADVIAYERDRRRRNGVNMPLLFHTDASQAAGIMDLNVARLGVDMMTLNAGKCYGPKQVGLLYVRSGIKLHPFILGGGQEMGLRSGTENVPGVIGFAKALALAEKTRGSEVKRLTQLRNHLKACLTKGLPDITFNESKHNSPAILNFSVAGVDGERVVFALDERGIQVSTGSACAANKGVRSRALMAMGLSDSAVDGSIRISMGRYTTADDVEKAGGLIVRTINEQRKFGVMHVA